MFGILICSLSGSCRHFNDCNNAFTGNTNFSMTNNALVIVIPLKRPDENEQHLETFALIFVVLILVDYYPIQNLLLY